MAKMQSQADARILLNILRELFDDNRAYVAVNGSQSEFFPLFRRVLQGSPLSPILYALFIDDIVSELNSMKAFPGPTRLDGRLFRCLLYTDDIAKFSLLHRLRFGIKKCAILQSNDISSFQL